LSVVCGDEVLGSSRDVGWKASNHFRYILRLPAEIFTWCKSFRRCQLYYCEK